MGAQKCDKNRLALFTWNWKESEIEDENKDWGEESAFY